MDHIDHESLAWNYPIHGVQLKIPKGNPVNVIVAYSSKGSLSSNFYLTSKEKFIEFLADRDRISFFYFGCLIMAILFNIGVFFRLKDPKYFYFIVFDCSLMFCVFVNVELWDQIVYPFSGLPGKIISPFSFILAIVASLQFSRSFLELKHMSPRLDRLMLIAIIAYIALTPFVYHPETFVFARTVVDYSIVSVGILLLVIGTWAYNKGYRPAFYYALGYGILTICVGVWLAMSLGLIERNLLTSHLVMYGQILKILILNFALFETISWAKNIEKRNKEREELAMVIQIVTHDVSTPLSLLRLQAGLRCRDTKNTDRNAWTMVSNKVDEIWEIISSVKVLSSLDKGKMAVKLERICLYDVLKDLEERFLTRLEAKNVYFQCDLENAKNYHVIADENLLRNQVLGNILSNAIKFSNKGGIIEIIIEQSHQTIISVCDQGIGIPENVLTQINQNELISSKTGTNGEVGTGFGLVIMPTLVERFGG